MRPLLGVLAVVLLSGCHALLAWTPDAPGSGDLPGDLRVDRPAGDGLRGDWPLTDRAADQGPADQRRVEGLLADLAAPDLTASLCAQPDLAACYRFEKTAPGKDDSGKGNDLTVAAVAAIAGVEGDAANLDAISRLKAPDSPSLSLASAVTIEAWVKPTTIPVVGRMGILDKQNAYGLFLYPGDQLYCGVGSASLQGTAHLAVGSWRHVACRHDGTTLQLFVDGVSVKSAQTPFAASTADALVVGGDSPSEGDRWVGALDSLRIWSVARTDQQLCTAAGKSSCP